MNENTAIKQSNERKQKKSYEKREKKQTNNKISEKKVDWRLTLSA